MIKFFRKIRQKLLSENRFPKYLLYALGEIILVMIGILLALQVNNWNEERKKENTVATYKKLLIEELKNEIIKSQDANSVMEEEIQVLFSISERISHSPVNIDTIMNIYRFEFNPEFIPLDINLMALDALISTGNINLMEKDLYNSLMVLKSVQEKTISTIENNINFYMTYSTRINVPYHDEWNLFQGEPLERIWEDIDKKGFLRDFSATLTSRKLLNHFIIKAQKEYIEKMGSVLRKLTEQDLERN